MNVEREGDYITLSMGPHHPATHGVLRLEVTTDGEVIRACKPDIGYLHRSIEKIGEFLEWYQFVPYTDRVDYVCSMNSNHAWVCAVETLLACSEETKLAIPERAEYIRILFAELNRISSHMVGLGSMTMDMGAFTPFLHALSQREFINDIFEKTCGARLTYNYMCVGGLVRDLHPGAEEEIRAMLKGLERAMIDFNRLISSNNIFKARLAGVAAVSAEDAVSYGLVGPNLRGSGIDFDLRRDKPYGLYGRFQFEVPVGKAYAGSEGRLGDCYDRYVVRLLEVLESIRICRQALDQMPPASGVEDDLVGGWCVAKAAQKALRKPPVGEVYFRCENPRGETGYHIVSDGTKFPYRIKIRTGSFTAMSIFEKLVPGLMIADLVALIGSFDIVLPEVDR
ncbi:MAG TPA: NADH-quinone oxidoreductase subunit D [Fibrobacteria bacterium]|nr:NADH-quinone oxidoreductase subunit D [Fibrobacteria bacterium]